MAIEDTLAQLEQAAQQANLANEKRYAQAMAIYDEIISRYQPGGEFGKAALGELELQKKRDVASETQNLISSGLYGTTTASGLPSRWESQVGAPARLKLEDLMMERLSGAQQNKASFIERREDVGPSYETIANLAAQASQGTTSSGGGSSFAPGSPASMGMSSGAYSRLQKELAEINAKYQYGSSSSSSYPSYSSSSSSYTPTTSSAGGATSTGGNDLNSWISAFEELYGLPAIQTGLEPSTGSVDYGERTAPTVENAPSKGGWINMVTGERKKNRPEPFNPASAWVYMADIKV